MRFMVSMRFHADDPSAMLALVPRERDHVRELTEQGVVESLYLAVDGSRGWMVMQGDSPGELSTLLEAFPLHPYMETEIAPLR